MTTTAEGSSRPQALRAYVGGVSVAGGVLFLYCLAHLAGTGVPPAWWVFAGLALITGRITLRVPGVEATFTVSEVFTFTCVLLFGPEAGAVTLALDSLVLAWHRRMAADKVCFNFANLTIAVWASGALFFRIAGVEPLFGKDGPAAELILPIAILGATYFVINTGLISIAIGFESRSNPLLLFRRHFMRLSLGYAASASLSLLLLSGLQQVHFGAIALLPLPPLLLVFYFTLRSSFGRLEDAKGHLDKLNTL
jgi:hypothetical protein